VYVGGGNTLYLMRIWRKTGFDKLLKRIANRDIVLGGISAGAICWFDGGFGDAVRKNGKMRMVGSKGLGFLPGICCPHYDDGAVRKTFNAFLAKKNKTGVALENCTAIAVDGERSVIYAKKGKGVYSVCGSKAARLT
jgi:dipeptidase E